MQRQNDSFDTLIAKARRVKAEFCDNLARCHDVYRLAHLLDMHHHEIGHLVDLADELVRELEEIQNA
jgi:hypothetical protein